jgi:hypothetical protein
MLQISGYLLRCKHLRDVSHRITHLLHLLSSKLSGDVSHRITHVSSKAASPTFPLYTTRPYSVLLQCLILLPIAMTVSNTDGNASAGPSNFPGCLSLPVRRWTPPPSHSSAPLTSVLGRRPRQERDRPAKEAAKRHTHSQVRLICHSEHF